MKNSNPDPSTGLSRNLASFVSEETYLKALGVLRDGLEATTVKRTEETKSDSSPNGALPSRRRTRYKKVPDWKTRLGCAKVIIEVGTRIAIRTPPANDGTGFDVTAAIERLRENNLLSNVFDAITCVQAAAKAKVINLPRSE